MTLKHLVLIAIVLGCAKTSLLNYKTFISPDSFEQPFVRSQRSIFDNRAYVFSVNWGIRLGYHELFDFRREEYSSPAVDPEMGLVLVGITRNLLLCIDSANGHVVWYFLTQGGVPVKPLIHEGKVYFGDNDGYIYALHLTTGKPAWKKPFRTNGIISCQPVIDENKLYFLTHNNVFYILDATTGKWIDQYKRENPKQFLIRASTSPLIYKDKIYVGFLDGHLVALNKYDRSILWIKKLAIEDKDFPNINIVPLFDQKSPLILVAAYNSGVYAINPEDGTIVWDKDFLNVVSISVDRDLIFLSTAFSEVIALRRKNQEILWRFRIRKGYPSNVVTYRNVAIFCSSESGLFAVHKYSGALLQKITNFNGASGSLTFVKKRLYVLSNNGFLFSANILKKNPRYAKQEVPF